VLFLALGSWRWRGAPAPRALERQLSDRSWIRGSVPSSSARRLGIDATVRSVVYCGNARIEK